VVKNPARGRQPRGGCRHLALQLPLVPTAQPPATGAPHAGLAWLVAGGQARPPRPAPNPAVRVATDPPDQRDFGSVARVSASATVDRAVDGLAANGASTRPGGQGRPATSTWSPPPPPEWGDGRVRTDEGRPRRLDTARMDTGQLDTGQLDSSRPTAGPSGRRPQVTGHRTAGQPDPGRQDRMGGHRLLDSGDRRRGVPAGRVDHGDNARPLESGWTLLWADAVWASNHQDRSTARTPGARTLPRMGLAAAATVSCRWYAAVQLAPWRTAVLGLDGWRVERTATLHPLWRWEVRLVCAAWWGALDGVQLWVQLVVRLSVL
jgi:hypothetical protein